MQNLKLSGLPDEILWHEFQNGNKEAYGFIYENYADNLYNYGMQITNNIELVEDAIQDLFVEMWRCKNNLAAVKSIKFYLFTCLRREIYKKVKKDSKSSSLENIKPKHLESFISIEDDILIQESIVEKNIKVNNIIKSLCKRQREILYLKFFENQSYQQISELLGLDLKYTYNTASRAFNLIKKNYTLSFFFLLLF
jgi:RNA polymerase sigma factor (sigma-70 family)